jgi:hypothetical protein
LENTKEELTQVEASIAKAQARMVRLREQQEQQEGKVGRLEAAIKEHHASIGSTPGKGGDPHGTKPAPPHDLTQCPAFVKLQQDLASTQQQLQEALAALANARPKRDRDQVDGDGEVASPAAKK